MHQEATSNSSVKQRFDVPLGAAGPAPVVTARALQGQSSHPSMPYGHSYPPFQVRNWGSERSLPRPCAQKAERKQEGSGVHLWEDTGSREEARAAPLLAEWQ